MNVAAVVLQMFVAPRLVKRFGVAGVLFALPLIALGAYGFVAIGATIAVVRWAKTAENSTDYSIMNTARRCCGCRPRARRSTRPSRRWTPSSSASAT